MTHASNFISIAVILGALAGLLVGLKAVEKKKRFHPEILRKGVHVGMGLVVLPLPWMLDGAWPMIVLGGLACATLVATRLIPSLRGGIGTVLGGVDREGLGEIYFAISVTILFLISQGEWLLYVVPILTLALADAAAAVIGIRYGQTQYQTSEGIKSVEGSLAFFLVTFFSAHLPLLLLTDTGRVEVVLIATILALLVMMLELVSWRGLDNLFIPLGTYAFLRLYLDEDPQALLIRVLVAIAFVTFTLAWRHRSKLDDSALVGCALFGYGAFFIGWLAVADRPLRILCYPYAGVAAFRQAPITHCLHYALNCWWRIALVVCPRYCRARVVCDSLRNNICCTAHIVWCLASDSSARARKPIGPPNGRGRARLDNSLCSNAADCLRPWNRSGKLDGT